MTNPHEKAIEAGAKEMCAAGCEEVPGAIDYHEMDAEEQAIILRIFRRAIAAYEAARPLPSCGAGLNADEVALVLAEDARIENGELNNVGYLAVKIAEQADERGRTALNALQKIATGHTPGKRDSATTAAVMRGIAIETLAALGIPLPTVPEGE